MGELRELGPQGDTKIIWDVENLPEVEAAEAVFDQLKEKGYYAYSVKKDGDKGIIIREFNPDAEKIIMALPMRGG